MSAYPNNLITIFIFKFLTFCISLFSFCRSHIGDHAYDHFLGKCPPPPLHRLLFISQLGWPSTVHFKHYQMLGFGRFANHNGKVVSVEGSKQCPVCGPFHDAKVHLDIIEDVY